MMSALTWSRAEQRVWTITMFMGSAILYAARIAMPLCMVTISKEMGWQKSQSGWVMSAFYWGYTITQVPGGYVADRIGGDTVLAVTTTGWSLLTLWLPLVFKYYPDSNSLMMCIVLLRVFTGCLQGVHYPCVTSLLSRRASDEGRSFSFAAASSGGSFGVLILGCFGSYLLEVLGWRSVFYIFGVTGLIWSAYLYLVLMMPKQSSELPKSIDSEKKIRKISPTDSVPWKKLFTSKALWATLIAHVCHGWAFNILVNWLPTYFEESFPNEKGWVFNVVPWSIAIPAALFAGWFADSMITKGYDVTLVRKIITTFDMVGCATFLALVSYTKDYHTALLLMTLVLTCNSFHESGVSVNPQDIAPKYAGAVYGIVNSAGSIPAFIGVFATGYILEMTHSWSAVFSQASFILFIGWIVYSVFATGKRIV